MKTWLLGSVFLIISASPLMAFTRLSGGTDGGGGRGVVCFADKEQKVIESVELLDFYEGRLLESFSFPERSGGYKDIYVDVIKEKASNKNVESMLMEGLKLDKGFKLLIPGTRLKKVEDSGEIFIPENCEIEQLVNFQGYSRIFVVKDFWDHLSETSKAGLLMHELIWYSERKSGVKSSARARRTVARFFSKEYDFGEQVLKPSPGDLLCESIFRNEDSTTINYGTVFFISKNPGMNECPIKFLILNGAFTYSLHTAELPACSAFPLDPKDPGQFVGRTIARAQVTSENDQSFTHEIMFTRDTEVVSGVEKPKVTIRVMNMEFPGLDEKPQELRCREISTVGQRKN